MSVFNPCELVKEIHTYLAGRDDSALSPFLADWPAEPFKTRTANLSTLPVVTCLPQLAAGAQAETAALIHSLTASTEHLFWGQTYIAEDFGADFLLNYGWTELIGLRGPIASRNIACGFLLLGPDTLYPRHSHAAEEVYVPLSAPTFWVQGDNEWVSRPSGVPIYHRPWLSHGMRTESTSLLALYLWRGGDLAQKSHIE